ncbi:glyoxalase/bleomycin resistance protein/dioxygenase [Isoalcanivorax pacificus W11-5]|uniref:Glyoxalase/bleomycin resistance protein/dioxygenase n=1 Tax=Isoalcanivorax pacificus W11-5 TaxID=391936 RepID=A0A0B4XK93_9GAMM|nr:VOC family protein [Isoalcanivorax pacificus]AJD46832.1 glyoxalase/bleomycin resistance protein/dioxygenase [Isoalcanivorax pacificus W11-5]
MMRPFHLAFPVTDLRAARQFYVNLLGAEPGRSTEHWADFDLFGHQLSAHRVDRLPAPAGFSEVDGKPVPVPHFGVILAWHEWETLAVRLADAGQDFILAPQVRYAGQTGEQGTFLLYDPAGNALEFKAFRRSDEVFA